MYTAYILCYILLGDNTKNMKRSCDSYENTILFLYKGLERLQSLVSVRTPGPNFPMKTKRLLHKTLIKFCNQFEVRGVN